MNSIDGFIEMEIAIRTALAQEKSRNMSENIKWGYKRKFERGDYFVNYKRFMGYRCENGKLVIVPVEAKIVKKIFDLYLEGKTLKQIKEYLESQHIKTATGKEIWSTHVIQKMLKNEKYSGCTLMQKTFSEDYMSGKRIENRGQRNMYYIEDSHPAIISKEQYRLAQEEMKRRARLIENEDGN